MRKLASFACPSHTLTLQPLPPSPHSLPSLLPSAWLPCSLALPQNLLFTICWLIAGALLNLLLAIFISLPLLSLALLLTHTNAYGVCFFIEQCVFIIMCCIIIFVLQNRRLQRSSWRWACKRKYNGRRMREGKANEEWRENFRVVF